MEWDSGGGGKFVSIAVAGEFVCVGSSSVVGVMVTVAAAASSNIGVE